MGAGEVDHLRRVLAVAERVDQLLVGGEEDLAVDRVKTTGAVGVDDADIDHRLADHGAARHAAEKAGDDVGDALAQEVGLSLRTVEN